MTQATQTAQNLATQLRESSAVKVAISTIVQELETKRQQITDTQGPTDPSLTQTFEQFMQDAAAVRGRPLLYPYCGSGIGNGALVEMMDGSVKFDLITGIGVHFFGHSDPDLVATSLMGATGDTVMQGHLMMNEEAVRFAEVLVGEAARTSKLEHAFLCNSGAMANENALKVCQQWANGAPRVLAFKHCFMGRSTTMAQIGDSAGGRQGVPLNALVDYMPFYDHVAARELGGGDVSGSTRHIDQCVKQLHEYIHRYPDQHSCFIFELVQGEGGFNTALPDFHRELMLVCREHGIAVWADEVQTFGRTEQMFCFEALGLGEYVDVATVGKMSQVCAALYTKELNPKPGLLSGTFLGSAVGLQTGQRILERLRDGDYYGADGRIARHHKTFLEHVEALAKRHPEWFPLGGDVYEHAGGFGGMMRFTPFGGEKEHILKLCRTLFDEGIIAFYCGHGPFHIRFLPPLGVLDAGQWPRIFEIVEAAMAKVAADKA